MKEQMLAYLQSMMDNLKKEEGRRNKDVHEDREYLWGLVKDMIACKEMVEALIGEPVNLKKDGKVTVGF